MKMGGYNSDDERGTADRPDLKAASPERSRLKRKADTEPAAAVASLAGTGLESDDDGTI
jgi:hypothetical protein